MRRFERHRRDERPRLEAMIRRFLDCADAANPCSDSRHQAMPAAGRRISSTACRLSRFGSRAAVGPRSCPRNQFSRPQPRPESQVTAVSGESIPDLWTSRARPARFGGAVFQRGARQSAHGLLFTPGGTERAQCTPAERRDAPARSVRPRALAQGRETLRSLPTFGHSTGGGTCRHTTRLRQHRRSSTRR